MHPAEHFHAHLSCRSHQADAQLQLPGGAQGSWLCSAGLVPLLALGRAGGMVLLLPRVLRRRAGGAQVTQPSAQGQGQAGGPGDYGWFAFNPMGFDFSAAGSRGRTCRAEELILLCQQHFPHLKSHLETATGLEMWCWRGISWDLGAFSSLLDVALAVGSLGMASAACGNRAAVSGPSLASPHPGGPIPSRQCQWD